MCPYKWPVDICILPIHAVYMGLSLCFILSSKDQNKKKLNTKPSLFAKGWDDIRGCQSGYLLGRLFESCRLLGFLV